MLRLLVHGSDSKLDEESIYSNRHTKSPILTDDNASEMDLGNHDRSTARIHHHHRRQARQVE